MIVADSACAIARVVWSLFDASVVVKDRNLSTIAPLYILNILVAELVSLSVPNAA